MALINEKGILSHKGEIKRGVSASGNEWARQTIVVSCKGYQDKEYKIALDVSLRELSSVEELQIGEPVEFSFAVSAREWQYKWFNNVDLYSIRKMASEGKAQPAKVAPVEIEKDEDLPF